jgi:hypothetical protein
VQKQIVRNQSGSALRAPIPPACRHLGKESDKTSNNQTSNNQTSNKKPDLTGRRLKHSPLKHDRMPPINQNDTGGADPTTSSYKADLAFQRAMQTAVARGLEHPPLIGVAIDPRPLKAPRLFEPVPHSSGCTSPAFECAELVARKDRSPDASRMDGGSAAP